MVLLCCRYKSAEHHVTVTDGEAVKLDFRLSSSVLETWSTAKDYSLKLNIETKDILSKDISGALEDIVSSSITAKHLIVSV